MLYPCMVTDSLLLAFLFAFSGFLALGYYHLIPSREELKRRLPNRVGFAGILLTIILGAAVWFIVMNAEGFGRFMRIFTFLLALLVFETAFLLLMRWVRSNVLAVLLALAAAAALFAWQTFAPSLALKNVLIVAAALGAPTLLVRMGYLRTRFLFLVAVLWTLYDVLFVRFLLPRVFLPAQEPTASLLYPALTVGTLTLGLGDVMFLILFALVLVRDAGRRAAMLLIALEAMGLLVTLLIRGDRNISIPFLTVMTPIFFLVFWVARQNQKRGGDLSAARG